MTTTTTTTNPLNKDHDDNDETPLRPREEGQQEQPQPYHAPDLQQRRDDEDNEDNNNDDDDEEFLEETNDDYLNNDRSASSSTLWTGLKLATAALLLWSAAVHRLDKKTAAATETMMTDAWDEPHGSSITSRRLQAVEGGLDGGVTTVPSYMDGLMQDLAARKKLFDDTPPEEVKYWFEYAGPLQKYFYRFSKSRGKADYFEGRDDSGVVSSRFLPDPGANNEYRTFYSLNKKNKKKDPETVTMPESERAAHTRLLDNCLAMGNPNRPNTAQGTLWNTWFGSSSTSTTSNNSNNNLDRCRILFAINSVGAGRGTTMLWETNPPELHAELPEVWTSEQETAATHLQRNLREIDALCQTGFIAARVQLLVCEPIPDKWVDWMDSHLVHCGGKPWPLNKKTNSNNNHQEPDTPLEDRPSPLQVVVTASPSTADSCHDLKSGFMEKRMQDLLLAPPYLNAATGSQKSVTTDPSIKTTSADLISTDDHDLYVAMRWSTLVTIRAVHAFLQASADIAAAASSPVHRRPVEPERNADGAVVVPTGPASPFLVPSFVRVSYVSEENPKVAKWRMHGDFFHPAAWEICKDSFDTAWIPHSLSGAGGVTGLCYADAATGAGAGSSSTTARRLAGGSPNPLDCGQWWLYFTELQMPMSPEVYANELTPPVVQGGSNFFWMVTERQRREVVKGLVCRHDKKSNCGELPQAVIPLGDVESFLINYTPNTALGHHHVEGRRPGYSREKEREEERRRVKERKQLHDQEEIEKALFDYTIYPAALFRKDATLKAARSRDVILTPKRDPAALGPQTVKSSYYDVTITKPRPPVLGWCQAIARNGLCTLYADYFRTGKDDRCLEACGLAKNWSKV